MAAAELDRVVARAESADVLDKPAEQIAAVLRKAFPPGPIRDLASGTTIGHPIHPLLVPIPIGCWLAGSILDLTGADGKAAKRLIGIGNLSALGAAASGSNDWLSTSGAERRVGLVHAGLNVVTLSIYSASWLARRRGHRARGALLALVGAAGLSVSGWLGGHLAHGMGVSVDTTAFQRFPSDWTDVAAEMDVPANGGMLADADGVPILLSRDGGRIVALADRCTHRGGPLHEGTFAHGCVTCPLHGSTFRLSDGTVVSGPASRPEPVLEVRVAAGRVQVRRPDEQRSLRTMPIGH